MKLTSTKYNPASLDWTILLLRVFMGIALLVNHGYPKLKKLIAGGDIKFADPIGLGAETSLLLATIAEVGCALLLILGLFTRFATIPLILTMAIAAFVYHAADPFAQKELSLLYFFGLLLLLGAGPGKFSIDKMISK